MQTNLNDILIFVAVVDAGSFVGGGHTMDLSRSAAGKAITRLEDRLGTRLLNRTTRRLSVTDEGRTFYEHGQQVIASIEMAEASVAAPSVAPRGVLRLTAPNALARHVVLPVIEKYLAAWPDIQVEVSFGDRLVDLVEEGFDLAVRIGVTAPDTRLVSRVVAKYQAVLCASPAYLHRAGEPREVEDLVHHDCLVFSSRGQRQAWRFRTDGGAWGRALGRSRLRLDSGEAVRGAALAGLGIAFLPDFMVEEDMAADRLCRVLPALDMDDEVKIVTLYPNKRLLEPRVRHFIDLMVEELRRKAG